ncbi:MAG: hypothetical protein ACI9DJ_003216, partial [Algoriphagus sp.]
MTLMMRNKQIKNNLTQKRLLGFAIL